MWICTLGLCGFDLIYDFVQLIFRDLKTSNILLDEDHNAKLSDFGLARQGPPEGLGHVSTAVSVSYFLMNVRIYISNYSWFIPIPVLNYVNTLHVIRLTGALSYA